MGVKSRGNYAGVCVKSCANRDKKCGECVRYSEWKEKEDVPRSD